MQSQYNHTSAEVAPSSLLGTSYDFNALFNSQVYSNETYSNKYYQGTENSQRDTFKRNLTSYGSRSNTLSKATTNIIRQSFKWIITSVSDRVKINNRQSSRTDSDILADNIVNDIYDTHLFLDLKYDGDDSKLGLDGSVDIKHDMAENHYDGVSLSSFGTKEKSSENFHTIKLNTTTRRSKGYELNLSSLFPPSPTSIKRSINKLNSVIVQDENEEEFERQRPENKYVYSNFKSFKWWKSDLGSNSISQKRIVPALSRQPHVIKRNRNNYSIDSALEDNDDERLASAIIKSRKAYKEHDSDNGGDCGGGEDAE